jgi:hypothetical protein
MACHSELVCIYLTLGYIFRSVQQARTLMTLAFIHSRARLGLQAPPVTIEVHLSNGLPGFQLVGLAETTVRV